MASRQAVAEAFAAHRGRVESVAVGILRDRDEARDVASDAFLALLEGGPHSPDATKTWLMVTARNRALNRARDLGRARQAQVLLERPDGRDQAPAPETLHFLLQAMRRLPERYTIALRLRYMEDQDYPAIAAAIGCPERQARIVVHRAARRLRREIILLLAEHRGASSTCRRLLLAGLVGSGLTTPLHKHCDVCAAVGEDLAELRMHGWLPLAPAWIPATGRFLDRVVASVAPRIPRLPVRERVAEAVTALLLTTGSFGAGAGAPAPIAPTAADTAAVQSSSGSVVGESATDARGQAGAPDGGQSEGLAPPSGISGPGTDPALPGLPVVRPDSINPGIPAHADIVSFSVQTERHDDGSPRALQVRMDLRAPPRPGTVYEIAWGGTPGCAALVGLDIASGAQTSADCSSGPLPDLGTRTGRETPVVKVLGRSVSLTLPLNGEKILPATASSPSGIVVRTLPESRAAEHDRAPDIPN